MSSVAPLVLPVISASSGNDAGNRNLDLWMQALNTLSVEDRKQFDHPSSSILDVLKSLLFADLRFLNKVQEATESKQKECVSRGWRLYRNKDGEEVKLRHVLEKISVWVKEIIKIIDVGVSLDQSGYAALPWAVVKYLTTIGFSDIDEFSNVAEGIESVSGLITRYTIVEKLYLSQQCEAKLGLEEAITKLYAATLVYLAKVKVYCTGNTFRRFGRSLIEAMRKQYEELRAKISETEVERWTKLVDVECEHVLFQTMSDLAYHRKVQRATREDATSHDQMLRDTLIGLRAERMEVFRWMSAIEYRNHHDNLSQGLLTQSGQWLLESQHFVEWGQSSVSSILWLHGIPGSGKTRLVSTVINTMLDANSNSSTSLIAFFYCARNTAEPERAKPVEIMGALLRQLASSKPDLPVKEPVAKEYEMRRKKAEDDCSSLKKLTVQDCTRLIIELIKDHPALIILDALDECEENTRHELLEAFDEIISHSAEVVKVFVSSRDDIDIKLYLENSRNISINVENNGSDIARFVQLEVDRLISKRLLLDGKVSLKFKRKMVETLINGAQGMFRWVQMSLEALKRIKFLPDFKKALGQLPSELSGLYDIIHAQIDQTETHGRDVAVQTLKWLLCAQRLLSAEELIAAVYQVDEDIATDSDGDSELESEQLQSPINDILRLCRNFVVFDSEQQSFRFAHQSVREYLLKQARYTAAEQHTLATGRCLDVYLTEWLEGSVARKMEEQNEIFKHYAEVYWPVHYKHIEDCASRELEKKVSRFTWQIQGTSLPYVQWILDIRRDYAYRNGRHVNITLGLSEDDRLGFRIVFAASRPDTILATASAFGITSFLKGHEVASTDWNQCQESRDEIYSLLSIAAIEGHDQVTQLLLEYGADVNAQGGKYGNALQAASGEGDNNHIVVQMLLDHGVDVNVQSGYYGNALQAACAESVEDNNHIVVQMLLDHGADVNAQGGFYGNALQAASVENNNHIVVQMLLDHGADVNVQGGYHGNALQAASVGDNNHIVVQMLLDHGANVNIQGGDFENALQAASSKGHDRVVRMLLDHGADVNVQGGAYENALQAASSKGHNRVVRMLLDHGADVNVQGGIYENALRAASLGGYDQVVRMLLDHEADVNAGNALEGASYNGHDQVVRILLDHEADVNAGNALEGASYNGYDQVVRMLLDHGADVNVGNALQTASYNGHDRVVRMLLDHGADVNAGNPLQAASSNGHDQVVQMLLDHGVDVNAGNALEAASSKGHDRVVRVLLDHGVDVNAGNALQAASSKGHDRVVRVLLDHGVDVNAGNALQAASSKGHDRVVRVLLDHGADVNAHDILCGTALQAASSEDHDRVVRMLLDHGADVNAGSALQAASSNGHDRVVQLLLKYGAKESDSPPA
ncbi:MAG: hypothetical protein ALECFALPRED_000540 [Alectoria fallacina]|uniref:NACHT domain-containing protein n=1 Tax=Alectoria fallacina TaxID=1903189 RepID=A0A8H3J9S8_9LECA|nr:MAG: hypothetical protein ALECFALPRED_000540 [Alectoria fallacina]